MPDKQSAALIATGSLVHRTSYLERAMDLRLSETVCSRADNGALWAHERILELPRTAEETSVFEEGCPTNSLTLLPHQQAHVRLSTGAGGLGLASAEARRMSASFGSRVGTLPSVLADLSGPLGDHVKRELLHSDMIRGLGASL